jgi:hypothetical protein
MRKMYTGIIYSAIAAAYISLTAIAAAAERDTPGAVVADAVEEIVTVRAVNQEARTVTVEAPNGNIVTIKVPPESQNLDQVYAGAKFLVRYLQSVAVFISPTGGEPSADEGTAMQLAEKGATPGGVIVTVKQVQARVDDINYDTRTVVLTGPEGDPVKLVVDDRVKRFNEVKKGDIVVVRYTEAIGMKMIMQ